jgi:hypothetical protein
MSERHDLVLSEASGAEPNPPGPISELRDLIRDVFPERVALTGAQEQQLRDAILSGFNHSELRELVRFLMIEILERITSNGPSSSVVLELIHWAQRHGRTEELILAVKEARPNNPAIDRIAATLLGAGWSKATSQQEIAKARKIRDLAMEKLSRLEIERLELIRERDEIVEKAVTERKRDELVHKEKMFALKTERLKAVVEALKVIKEMDIKLTVRTMKKIEAVFANLADPSDP